MRPKIKISGIVSVEDALAALDCGADYITLQNVKNSKRYLDLSQIIQMASLIPAEYRRKIVIETDSGSYETLMHALRKAEINALQYKFAALRMADVIKMRRSGIKVFQYEYLTSSADILNVNLNKDSYDYAVFDIKPAFISKADRFTASYKVARIVRDIFNEIKGNISLNFYGVSGDISLESVFTLIQGCKPNLIDLSTQFESPHSIYKAHDRMQQFFAKLNSVFPNVKS